MTVLKDFDKGFLKNYPALIGIDESGRGCLAGPVVAAGVFIDKNFQIEKEKDILSEVNDSKKLSEEKRQKLYSEFESWENKGWIRFAWAQASVTEIDTFNIFRASGLAMHRVVEKLLNKIPEAIWPPKMDEDMPLWNRWRETATKRAKIIIDGKPIKKLLYVHEAIVKGDAKSLVIAMASIIAKVMRDRLMGELAQECPCYGLEVHKGYATQEHRAAIREHGTSEYHRKLFVQKVLASAGQVPMEELLLDIER